MSAAFDAGMRTVPWNSETRYLPIECKPRTERGKLPVLMAVAECQLGSNPRYAPTLVDTYCSTFLWDCTRRLGCEVPHWVSPAGAPSAAGEIGARELNANGIATWLRGHGVDNGWMACTEEHARETVEAGNVVIVVWENTRGPHGHCAVMVDRGHVAQAGTVCSERMPLHTAFGNRTPEFYVHL